MKASKILITGGSGFIGTNLINDLENLQVEILNIDKDPPHMVSQRAFWKQGNIMNYDQLAEIFERFQPTHVIHLAARTDTDSNILSDYDENVFGTKNILNIVSKTPSVERLIITSTQFVNQYNGVPKNDLDFAPHTTYGESKVINEQDTRSKNLSCTWTIIRPTNIWGPWHKRYPYEFWKILADNKYIHPGKMNITRSYGYVGNVTWQISRILNAPDVVVNKKVFYVGDHPIKLYDWANGFALAQTGKNVRIVPPIVVKTLALAGEALKLLKIKFPITLSRYKSMTTSNAIPMTAVHMAFGTPPYSLQQGIEVTVYWMKTYHPELLKINR
jgi:nucleoside-diphosphate-sugar epimerase